MKKDKRILIPRDEFEEEASEGLGRLSREEAEADLRELKARMERRVTRPRAIWLPAAAAVVILVVASGILVTMLRPRQPFDSTLAQKGSAQEEASLEENTVYQGMEREVITDTALIAMAAPIEKQGVAPGVPGAQGARDASGSPGTTGRIVPVEMADAVDEMYAVAEEDVEVGVMADNFVVEDEPVVRMIALGEFEAEEVIVEALPQMNARENLSKKTDKRPAREAADMRDRAVAEPAITEAKQAAGTKETAKVEAGVVPAADTAPVTGAVPSVGAAQNEENIYPSPVGGWERYREWTALNIRYPEAVQPRVRQQVVVSFTVRADSTITDLKAVSTPGEPFTREVFRLLREGPHWIPVGEGGRMKEEKVMLMFVFR